MEQQVTENSISTVTDRLNERVGSSDRNEGEEGEEGEEVVEKADYVASLKGLLVEISCTYKGEPLGFVNSILATAGISWLLFLVFLMVFCGTFNTILFKLQIDTVSKGLGASPPRNFEYPFIQTLMNLAGRFFVCLSLYWFKLLSERFLRRQYLCFLCKKSKKKQDSSVDLTLYESEDSETELDDVDLIINTEKVEQELEQEQEGDSEKTNNEEDDQEQENEEEKEKEEHKEEEEEQQQQEKKQEEEEEGGGEIITEKSILLPTPPTPPEHRTNREETEQPEQMNTTEDPPEKKKLGAKHLTPFAFIFPAICDSVGSSFGVMALVYTYASVVQMLRGCNVVLTAGLSIIFLKSDLYRYPHKTGGILTILLGIGVVGYSSIEKQAGSDHGPKNAQLGIILVVIGELLRSIKLIFDEKFLKGYRKDPLQVAGIIGFWGIPIQLMILMVLYNIRGESFGSFENFPSAVVQSMNNEALFSFILLLLINIGIYNFAGNWITKHLSAVHRVTIELLRNVNIWIFEILFGRETFSWSQLIGFVFIVIGTALYNQVGFGVFCPWYLSWMNSWSQVRVKDCFRIFYECILCRKGSENKEEEVIRMRVSDLEMELKQVELNEPRVERSSSSNSSHHPDVVFNSVLEEDDQQQQRKLEEEEEEEEEEISLELAIDDEDEEEPGKLEEEISIGMAVVDDDEEEEEGQQEEEEISLELAVDDDDDDDDEETEGKWEEEISIGMTLDEELGKEDNEEIKDIEMKEMEEIEEEQEEEEKVEEVEEKFSEEEREKEEEKNVENIEEKEE